MSDTIIAWSRCLYELNVRHKHCLVALSIWTLCPTQSLLGPAVYMNSMSDTIIAWSRCLYELNVRHNRCLVALSIWTQWPTQSLLGRAVYMSSMSDTIIAWPFWIIWIRCMSVISDMKLQLAKQYTVTSLKCHWTKQCNRFICIWVFSLNANSYAE